MHGKKDSACNGLCDQYMHGHWLHDLCNLKWPEKSRRNLISLPVLPPPPLPLEDSSLSQTIPVHSFFCSHCKIWLLPWWRRPCSAVYLFRNSDTGSTQKISVVLLWLAVWELECVGFGVLIACCCERRWSCGARSLCPKQRLTSRTSLASTYHSLRHHRDETQNWRTVDPTPGMQFSEKCSQRPVFHSHWTDIYKQHRRTS